MKKDTIALALSSNKMILSIFENRNNSLNDRSDHEEAGDSNDHKEAGVEETITYKKDAPVQCSDIDDKDDVDTESEMLKWFMSRD